MFSSRTMIVMRIAITPSLNASSRPLLIHQVYDPARSWPLLALTATIYNVDIDLADLDRGVYESLALRIARHPSESEEYLVTRILAYALEFHE